MITFQVKDMSCGHCVGAVTQAVKTVDPAAEVRVDLGTHRVEVTTSKATAEIGDAIRDAGYTPQPI